MELTLLGTGCPQVATRRFGPANLVRHGALALLVDCGSGATQRLLAAGSSGAALDAVFLTHLHSDHIVDLYQLIVSSWHQGRAAQQRIFGPPGTRRYIDGLMALWKPELDLRIAHERRPSTRALEIDIVEFAAGEIWRHDGLAVRAVEVRHQPVQNAFGFVFEAEGRKLAFSGDTAYSPELIAAARGADVLVHECFIHREMPIVAGVRSAETLAAVASYHTQSHEVGKVARESEARCLILNHFVPVDFDRPALLTEVRRDYRGPIIIGEDLMRYDLATGALTHADGVIGIVPFAG